MVEIETLTGVTEIEIERKIAIGTLEIGIVNAAVVEAELPKKIVGITAETGAATVGISEETREVITKTEAIIAGATTAIDETEIGTEATGIEIETGTGTKTTGPKTNNGSRPTNQKRLAKNSPRHPNTSSLKTSH